MRRAERLKGILFFFFKKFPALVIAAMVSLLLSQFFLVGSFLLPIKVVILLSQEELPAMLNSSFFDIGRNATILMLTLLVVLSYGSHVAFERLSTKLIQNIVKQLLPLQEERVSKKNKLVGRFIDSFVKFISTFVFLAVLFLLAIYLYPLIGIFILTYMMSVYYVFTIFDIERHKRSGFFRRAFGIGFMLVFITEVIDVLYMHSQEASLLIIVIALLLSRYIFLRGAYIMNQLIFIFSNEKAFFNKIASATQ